LQSQLKTRFGSRQVLLAALAVLLSSYISYAAGLATNVLTARALGPEEFGKLAYFIWLTGILVIAFNNGITVTLIRFLAESVGEGNYSKANGQEIWLKNALWICIVALSGLCAFTYRYLGLEITAIPLAVTVILLLLAAIAKSIYIFDVSKAKGYGEFNIEPRSSSLLAILSAVLTVIVYLYEGQTIHYLLIFLLASILHPLFSRYLLSRPQITPTGDGWQFKPDSSFRSHLYWSSLLCIVSLSSNRALETYLLNAYYSSSEVGKFIVAATLARAGLDLVSVGMNAVLMPVLGHGLGSGGPEEVDKITQRAVKYMFFLGLLFSGTCYFFADPLVAALYGKSFAESALAFKVLITAGGLTLASGVFGAYLSTTNQQKPRAFIAMSSAVIQGVVAALAVPKFGLWGAVASTSIGGLVVNYLLYYRSTRTSRLALPNRELTTAFAIFLGLMAILLLSTHLFPSNYSTLAAGFVFGVLFSVLSLIFGVWSRVDICMAKNLFSKRTVGHKFFSYLEKSVR